MSQLKYFTNLEAELAKIFMVEIAVIYNLTPHKRLTNTKTDNVKKICALYLLKKNSIFVLGEFRNL